jgi:hypothetical protein
VRRILLPLTIFSLALTACAPDKRKGIEAGATGGTGFFDKKGNEYSTNGDPEVEKRYKEQVVDPNVRPETPSTAPDQSKQTGQAQQPTPQAAKVESLKARISGFEISRFDGASDKPSQFGRNRVQIKVFFRSEEPATFTSPFKIIGERLFIEARTSRYVLKGDLTDLAIGSDQERTRGLLTLTDTSTRDSIEASYRASRADITVRVDRTKKVATGSVLDRQIKALTDRTFGWQNNWVVINGPAFYVVDIVRVLQAGDSSPQTALPTITIRGESKRTDGKEFKADMVNTNGPKTEARLVGNSEQDTSRLFAVQIEDQETRTTDEVMIDVRPRAQDESVPQPDLKQPIEYGPDDEDNSVAPNNADDSSMIQNPARPPNLGGAATTPPNNSNNKPPAQRPDPVVRPGQEYLQTANLPTSQRMVKDFNRNRNIPGVRNMMAKYQSEWRRDLQNFYDYANPFRSMLEAIGRMLDVSPVYAYLTVVESTYFTGGKYKIQGNSDSSALGPFQLISSTAKFVNVKVTGNSADERRYFAPSACGAARYIRHLVDQFDDSDSTIAILAYYQGPGIAAAAIHCSYNQGLKNRAGCGSRNGRYSGDQYKRFRRFANNYNYSYAEMDKLAAIPKRMRDYVNKKLAVYFISQDMKRYMFGFSRQAPSTLPTNGTVVPNQPIKDDQCRQTIDSLTGV